MARMAALAKASSAAAAALGGLAAGFAIYVAGLLDKACRGTTPTPPPRTVAAAIALLCGGPVPGALLPGSAGRRTTRTARRMTVRPTGGERPRAARGRWLC